MSIFAFFGVSLGAEKSAFDCLKKHELSLRQQYSQGLKNSGAENGLFFIVLNGQTISGSIFDATETKISTDSLNKTYPLGETTVAFVSLLALSLEEQSIVSTKADVNKYFSEFRSSSSSLSGVNVENLLSQTAGVPYLADKIPFDSSCVEFFDAMAQMNFSLPDVSYSRSLASTSIAGYALAYACEPNSKDLKKSFVRALRKFLFEPLKIKSPKFRHFDKWYFSSVGLALNADSIKSWLECETSFNPKISIAQKIASRRSLEKFSYSQGWKRRLGVPCECFVASSAGNTAMIYKLGDDTLAIAMFSDAKNLQQSEKLFGETAKKIDDIIKNNKK